MNVCLIPARGGSKRIKNKNIIRFFNKPIISYAIIAAKKSKLFDEIYVSTDSIKIKKVAEKFGCQVPYIRDDSISNDYSTDKDVLLDFANYFRKSIKKKVSHLCYIYPCNPLINYKKIIESLNKLKKNNFDKIITVKEFQYPIQRALELKKKDKLVFREKKNINVRSQNLKKYFHDAGQIYWYKFSKLNKKSFDSINNNTGSIILNEFEGYDIDEMNDLKNVRKIYKNKLHL